MSNPSPHTPLSGALDAPCKCCGAKALQVVARTESPAREQQTIICSLCSDGWVSTITEEDQGRGVYGQWRHTPGWDPQLVRTIDLPISPSNFVPSDIDDKDWDYYVGGYQVEPEDWFGALQSRREAYKGRLAN